MNVSAVGDLLSFLPQQATGLKAGQVQQQIQVAVMKAVMDQQKTSGEAIARMIQSTTPGGIDIRV